MPRDMYYGSKMIIYNHNGKEIEGMYINQINEILASNKVPNENLIFLEDYSNILSTINNDHVLEICKDKKKVVATIKKHSEYYQGNSSYEEKVEGKDFFEVLNCLNEKLEKNMTKPKIYHKILMSFFNKNTKNYL